jgi:hypothetical protein
VERTAVFLSPSEDDAVPGAMDGPRDEGSPALVVAGVDALVLAWLAAPDVAQQPVAVAGVPFVPAVVPADAAVAPAGVAVTAAAVPVAVAEVPAVLVMPADVAGPDVAAVLVAAGAAVVLAVQASWACPGVPVVLGVFAEQVAPGEPGGLVALAAPAELAAPVPEAPARLAWVEETAGRRVLPLPAFLPEEAVAEDD